MCGIKEIKRGQAWIKKSLVIVLNKEQDYNAEKKVEQFSAEGRRWGGRQKRNACQQGEKRKIKKGLSAFQQGCFYSSTE